LVETVGADPGACIAEGVSALKNWPVVHGSWGHEPERRTRQSPPGKGELHLSRRRRNSPLLLKAHGMEVKPKVTAAFFSLRRHVETQNLASLRE
jgi:hypothetical protein